MTPARRKRIEGRDGLCCAFPGCTVATGLEVDHIVPLCLGGRENDGNLQLLCYEHHKAKTRLNVRMHAKAKRIIKKSDPTQRKPSRLQGRGFSKGLTKRFDGSVVRREVRP